MEYKKTYKGFLYCLMMYLFILIGLSYVTQSGVINTYTTIYLILNITNIWILALTYIIYKTENIYWFTGIIYEDAKNAGSVRRKQYALKHLKIFGKFTVIYMLLNIIFVLLHINIIISTLVWIISLIATALLTMKYEL